MKPFPQSLTRLAAAVGAPPLGGRGDGSRRGSAWCSVAVASTIAVCITACDRRDTPAAASRIGAPSVATPATTASPAPSHSALAKLEVSPSLERSCREICDRSQRLNCENAAQCMPNCLAMGSLTPCTDKITAFYQCLVGQPIQNWECAPDGVAAIRNGLCDKEQGDTVACMEAKMQ